MAAGSLISLRAEDKPATKPTGSWERKVGDTAVQLHFKDHTVRFAVKEGDNAVEVDADYGITKTGTVFGIITKVEKKGGAEGPSEGDLFSFVVSVDKDTLALKELKGTNTSDEARQLVEGEWKKLGEGK
jgi:hypothetical protein